MRLTSRTAGALTLALACAAFSGAAFAGNGNGGEAPGNSADAPGQQKKADDGAASSQAPATPPGQAKKAEPRPLAASKGKSASAPGRTKAATKRAAAGGPRTSGRPDSPGRSAEAQDHVLLCHATGSDTNPYVIINISKRGWENGHSKHDGDVLLRDADVGPGDKPADFGLSEASCPAPVALTTTTAETTTTTEDECPETRTEIRQVLDYVLHATGSAKNPYVRIEPNEASAHVQGKHSDDLVFFRTVTVTVSDDEDCPPTTTTTTTTTTEETVSVAGVTTPTTTAGDVEVAQAAQQPAAGGVAGVQTRIGAPAAAERGGVLGALAEVGEAELPFTGLPLWIAALAGLGLAGAGYGVRRATR